MGSWLQFAWVTWGPANKKTSRALRAAAHATLLLAHDMSPLLGLLQTGPTLRYGPDRPIAHRV